MRKVLATVFVLLFVCVAHAQFLFPPILYFGPSSAKIVFTGTDVASEASGCTSCSFSSFPIGTPSPGRYVLLAIANHGSSAGTASSVVIGGVSATKILSVVNTTRTSELWIALVPTGTTATVTFTESTASAWTYIGAWALYYLQNAGAATATASATTSGGSMSLSSIYAGGVAVATAANATDGDAFTWSGLSSTAWNTGSAADGQFSGADEVFATAQSSYSVSATTSGATPTFVAASFR